MLKATTITLECKILNVQVIEQDLVNYAKLYSSLERKLFNQLKDDPEPNKKSNELQRFYVKTYNIHARIFKSLWRQVTGRIKSIKSNQSNYETKRNEKIKELKNKLKNIKEGYKHFGVSRKINKLTQLNKQPFKVSSTWGSKAFFKKQWNYETHEKWLEEWRIRRDHNMFLIGSHDETFGNSLCQLQTLNQIRLTLPHSFDKKHITLEVDFDKKKKVYGYLKQAITNKKSLTFRIFQSPKNRQWYVQVSFTIENDCDHYNSTIGVDINYNLISTSIVKSDGNSKNFIDYRFEIDDNNKNRNNQTLSDIVNKIVDCAVENKTTITIEKINLKNVVKYKKISLVCYNKLISLLKSRCIKNGVLLLEVNPAYTSVIGQLKYSKRLGRSRHSCASYTIGRRGLNYIENIPSRYIYLLHSEEKDKSLLAKWDIINKRLKKVSLKEKSRYSLDYRDQSTFGLNSC